VTQPACTGRGRAWCAWCAFALLLACAAGCRPADDGAPGRVLSGGTAGPGTPPDARVLPPGGDFTLHAPGGQPFALADLRGQAVVLFFGFASCPDFCPRAMSTARTALAGLDATRRGRVRIVFVSVDPERDTPAALEAYLRNFAIPAVGVTGTHEELKAAIRLYGGDYERDPPTATSGYTVMHPTSLYVVDPAGRLRAKVDNGDADALAAALREVL
jgi:protein SCO1/2